RRTPLARIAHYDPATALPTLSLHRALPISLAAAIQALVDAGAIRAKSSARDASTRGRKPTDAYVVHPDLLRAPQNTRNTQNGPADRKSTRLNSSHRTISYAVFCLKKKTRDD